MVTPRESHHPFLITVKEEFPSLRNKANSEPWKAMKEDALKRASGSSATQPYKLQDYVGALALAYILDDGNSEVHAQKVKKAILEQYAKLDVVDGQGWEGVVPNLGSFYMAILALDVVYDALSDEEIEKCEEVISDQIFKISRQGSWQDVRSGTHGTWDIYKGDRKTPDDEYYQGIMNQITEDGVSPVTIHYAWERVGGGDSRLSKSGYMDVLEYTGIDKRYYENERLQKFQRWLFGSSVNCSREMAIIGDMLPTQNVHNDMLHRRVVNFDQEAAGYAAWFHERVDAKGNILTYVLPRVALPDPVEPGSQLYHDGGAFFREKGRGDDGLHMVLYNIKAREEWHTHEEVNGLAFSGYGNRLLVNGGRLGAPVRAAALNNTLTINKDVHDARTGEGIVEGFTTEWLDYASGSAGRALTSKDHFRNILLIHSSDQTLSYGILFDEVVGAVGDQIVNYLHPANQSSVLTILENEEYTAPIDHYAKVPGINLSFYFATPPESVATEKVASAVPDRYPGYPDHSRLGARYIVGDAGIKNLVTVLAPYSDLSAKPGISRIADVDWSGCTVHHNDHVRDIVLELSTAEEVNYEGIIVQGKALALRMETEKPDFYFVRMGMKLEFLNVGFISSDPVSIFMKGTEGAIISDGAEITLIGPGISNAVFEPALTIIDSSPDRIVVSLPPGTVKLL